MKRSVERNIFIEETYDMDGVFLPCVKALASYDAPKDLLGNRRMHYTFCFGESIFVRINCERLEEASVRQ